MSLTTANPCNLSGSMNVSTLNQTECLNITTPPLTVDNSALVAASNATRIASAVVMTTVSTLLAMGTMPLWLFLFPLMSNSNNTLRVPFDQLGFALLGIIPPVLLGLPVNYKFPKRAPLITKICTASGFGGIVLMSIILAATQRVNYSISWRQIVVLLLFPSIGLTAGYLATRLPWLKYDVAQRRTVAIETGMQNTALGVSIVLISFSITLPEFGTILLFPAIYGGLQVFLTLPVVAVYRLLKWRGHNCLIPAETGEPPTNGENGIANPAFEADATAHEPTNA
uniref:Ileal sodium/bile acid cotransporter n=1 Tax=Ciona savignyi TaxID=51511 RepID=H2ZIH5_CIOSA